MFDLPVVTTHDRKRVCKIPEILLKSGFLMLQESVYCRLMPNTAMADALLENLRKNKPESGLVQVLKVTEKQYQKMEYLVGERCSEVLDTDERLIIL